MNQQLLNELLALKQRDSDTRSRLLSEGNLYGDYALEMQQVHRENAIQLDNLVSKYGWPGTSLVGLEGCRAAWLIAQHSICTPELVSKVGFDFDEFGGNVDILIVRNDKDKLANSSYMKSLQGDWQFEQQQGQEWSFYNGTTHPAEGIETLAKEISKEFSTQVIYFYFGDASGWMGYKYFLNGGESEEYSFGQSYDEELAEMGVDLAESRKDGTVVANNEEGDQFLFWSRLRTKAEDEICGGEKFIDDFLHAQKAYIGWDLFPGN